MNKTKSNKEKQQAKLKFISFEQVLKENSRFPEFKREYENEVARLRLVFQLKRARQTKKLTQRSVARRAGMPQSVVARIEAGKHNLSIETLQRVARAVGKEIQLV